MRVVSGIQPTGELHLGNYLGALSQWVALQSEAECFFFLADLHAITVPQDPMKLRQQTLDTAALLLAIGIDPERSVFFLQSRVPQHAELAWILNCFTTVGELRRMVQFKDKSVRKGEFEASAGLFTYPALQAADILLYQADGVPIGEDQKQHLELTRTLAQRFNARYSEFFKVPKPLMITEGARIMDLHDPSKKMSKSMRSLSGLIRMTDSPDAIRSKIAAATTDSGYEIRSSADKPGITNLITIYSLVAGSSRERTESLFSGKTYAAFKTALADILIEHLGPYRERYEQLNHERSYVERVLLEGSYRAQATAMRTLAGIYERVGFLEARPV